MNPKDRTVLLASFIALFVGVLLLGRGSAGMVAVGSSCCFGPSCPADNQCKATAQTTAAQIESPSAIYTPYSMYGAGLILLTAFYLLFYATQKRKHIATHKIHIT